MWRNDFAGIEVADRSAPTIIACRVHDHVKPGIAFDDVGTMGRLECCDLWANRDAGLFVAGGADPFCFANRICGYGSQQGLGFGVLVCDGGRGRLEGNIICGSNDAGVAVTTDGDPILIGNVITDHAGSNGFGFFVNDSARGRSTLGPGNIFARNAGGDMVEAIASTGSPGPWPWPVSFAGAGEAAGEGSGGRSATLAPGGRALGPGDRQLRPRCSACGARGRLGDCGSEASGSTSPSRTRHGPGTGTGTASASAGGSLKSDFKVCSACARFGRDFAPRYCGARCQRAHWPAHRAECARAEERARLRAVARAGGPVL